MQHHEDAIDTYARRAEADPEVLAVLVTGSVARGVERADSDVDLVVVVGDAAWERAVAAGRIMFTETEGTGWRGGYFDVKLATTDQLAAVAEHGDGPVLSSLRDARVVLDRTSMLEGALAAVRAEATRPDPDLAAALVAQARLHGEYFVDAAERSGDALLLAHAAVHLATAAGRAALALAGVPFPGPKGLMDALRVAPGVPGDLVEAITDAVMAPGGASAARLLAGLEALAGDLLEPDATLSRFVLDNELAWWTRRVPPEYR